MPSLSKRKARKNRAVKNSRVPKGRNRKVRGLAAPEIWVLGGGLSSRMGKDKLKVRVNGRTVLEILRERFGKVRVQRKDAVTRCGPLGGVVTVLRRTKAERVVFLACDMPEVSVETMRRLAASKGAAFCAGEKGAGFPFVLPRSALPMVEEQIGAKQFALQKLAERFKARLIRPARKADLINLNTPEELAAFTAPGRGKG